MNYKSTRRDVLRLGALVATNVSQGTLILGSEVTVPLGKESNEVDLVCLAAVYSLEVIVTVERVELVIVGELLLGDRVLALQAEDSVDVFLSLRVAQCSPWSLLVGELHRDISSSQRLRTILS